MVGKMLLYFNLGVMICVFAYHTYLLLVKAGKYVYRVKRSIFRVCGINLPLLASSIFLLIGAIEKDKLIFGHVMFVVIILILIGIQITKGEGLSEKGVMFSIGFSCWDNIIEHCWKDHFSKDNCILALRLKNKQFNYERYIVISKKYKNELDREIAIRIPKTAATEGA